MESVPYDKRSGKIWFNGEPIDWSKVKIHVLSHGLHYASCVFEGERVYDGEIFKLEEHTERLFPSASRMGIKIPYSQELLNKATKDIVAIQKIACLECLNILANACRFFIGFYVINHPIPFFECIIISLLVLISGFIAFVPGNIGIREIAVGGLTLYMDYGFDYGLLVTSLDRLVASLWFATLGSIFFYSLQIKSYKNNRDLLTKI